MAVNYQSIALSDQVPAEIDAGPGTYTFDSPAISNSGDIIYRALFNPDQEGADDIWTLWKDSPNSNQLVAKTGDDAQVSGHSLSLVNFDFPEINQAGEMAFYGLSTTEPTPDGRTIGGNGVWKVDDSGALSNIVVHRAPSPQTGFIFTSIGGFHPEVTKVVNIGPSGDVLFNTELRYPETRDKESATWSTTGGLHRAYSYEPNSPIAGLDPGVGFDSFEQNSSVGESGQSHFISYMYGPGIDSTNNVGIFSEQNGIVNLVWQQGDTTPGIDPTITILAPSFVVLNSSGQALATADIQGFAAPTRGLVLIDPEGLSHIVAANGSAAPGTPWSDAIFGRLNSGDSPPNLYTLNDMGQSVFMHSVHSPSTEQQTFGVWADDNGATRMVAMGGMQAPGIPEAVFFPNPTVNSPVSSAVPSAPHIAPWFTDTVTINDSGQAAILAGFQTPEDSPYTRTGVGIWAEDADSNLTLLVRTGDSIPVGPGDVREIRSLSLLGQTYPVRQMSTGKERNSGFNELRQLTFKATFTDGTSGIFLTNALTVPEPAGLLAIMIGLLSVAIFYRRPLERPCK